MPTRLKGKRILLEELKGRIEELGRQKMTMLGCHLKIAGIEKEIRTLRQRLDIR